MLALITDGFGARGGIGRYNRDLLTALSLSPAISQVVALPRFGKADATVPAKVSQLRAVPGRLGWSAAACRAAMRQRFDVVLCGHMNALPLAAGLARVSGARLWVQVHGIEAWDRRGPLARASLATASLVTSVSRFTRRRLLAWSDVPPERVRVLPNTYAGSFARRSPRRDLVERYGLNGRRVVLTVGRIASTERYKGHDRIIAALPAVAERVPDVAYLIVGSGDDAPRLEALARDVGVAERVIFAGQVPDADIADHFALASVFAMPSTGEGFGIVFLEAAASGVAVIGGNRDGSADALADGAIGAAIDPVNAEDLTAALAGALEGRQTGNPDAAHRFAFSNFARHVDDLVRQLAAD